jgi:ankyrin repeat protein
MHRTACFGRCPIYTIELKGGGQAHYHGDNFTLVHGDHDFSLPTEAIQCLVADFRTIDFWSLADRYAAQVTDLQATVLTLEIGGHKKSLIDYGGDMVGMPASVTDMENAIDAAASGPWALGDATTVASLKAEHLDFRSAQAADILARAAELDKPEVALDLLAAGARPIGHGVSMDGPLGLNPIESAARNGRAPLVRALIAAGVFEQGEAGLKERALLAAVANGDSEIVAEILKQNPNVDGRTDDGTTALMEVDPESNDPPVTGAAEHQVSIARQLLAAGADARLLNEAGKSALFDLDNPDIVRLMVKAGAVLEQRNSAGETPLISAQSDAAAMALIEAGADVTIHDDKGEGLWAQATENKWPRVLAYLAAHGTVHGSPKPRPVSWPPRLKALIRRRFDFHSREAVLMLGRAASEGRDRLALGLLAAGVPANQVSGGASYDDTTAIKIASAAGDIGLVRALIAAGALRGAPYHAGENALIAAVAAPYPDVVSVLCAAGVDVNAHDSLGATALTSVGGDEKQRAASLQTIRILLAAKAAPGLRTVAARPRSIAPRARRS